MALVPLDGTCDETLFADMRIQGVWQPQVDAVFDVHVVDTNAPSYQSRSLEIVLHSAEVEKKEVQSCLSAWLIMLALLPCAVQSKACLALRLISFYID